MIISLSVVRLYLTRSRTKPKTFRKSLKVYIKMIKASGLNRLPVQTLKSLKTVTAVCNVFFLKGGVKLKMEAITACITNAITCVGTAFTAMMDNPVIAIFVGCSLVGASVAVFARMKRSAR